MNRSRLAAVVFVSLLHIACIFAFFFMCLFNPSLFLCLTMCVFAGRRSAVDRASD